MKYIFTDGSAINNGKLKSYGGIGIHFSNMKINDVMLPFIVDIATNNKTELYAISRALETLLDHYISKKIDRREKDYTIVSDSEYAIKSSTVWLNVWKKFGWKTSQKTDVKNICLIQNNDILLNIAKKLGMNIKFMHIHSHQKEPKNKHSHEHFLWKGNYTADKLAKKSSIEIGKFIR
jgi:ribonuclease HI